jgi:integrase
MSKRANGEGTITLRGDGRYMYRWIDQDGRRRAGYAKSKSEAATALWNALQRVEEGVPAIETAEAFRKVAERWRQTALIRHNLAPRSLGTYWPALKLHAFPVIGDKRMRDIRPADVAAVMVAMDAKGLSVAYRNITLKAISNVCEEAIADGLIRANPTRKVKSPRPGRSTKVVPNREQVTQMIDEAPTPRARLLIAVLAHTGLRISEALSLRWADLDGGTTLRVLDTKGDRPRAAPVTPTLAEELKAWRKVQTEERIASVWWDVDADLIICTNTGTRWDSSNARRHAFRPVADKVCPGATPHSLRHAAATILLVEGVPLKVVSELLGHSSTRTTAEISSHVTARLVAEAGTALERALG